MDAMQILKRNSEYFRQIYELGRAVKTTSHIIKKFSSNKGKTSDKSLYIDSNKYIREAQLTRPRWEDIIDDRVVLMEKEEDDEEKETNQCSNVYESEDSGEASSIETILGGTVHSSMNQEVGNNGSHSGQFIFAGNNFSME